VAIGAGAVAGIGAGVAAGDIGAEPVGGGKHADVARAGDSSTPARPQSANLPKTTQGEVKILAASTNHPQMPACDDQIEGNLVLAPK
jgi:hypothetical protein